MYVISFSHALLITIGYVYSMTESNACIVHICILTSTSNPHVALTIRDNDN